MKDPLDLFVGLLCIECYEKTPEASVPLTAQEVARGFVRALDCLSELSEYDDDDSGLWEGQEPRQAILTQATYCLGRAISSLAEIAIKERFIAKVEEAQSVA